MPKVALASFYALCALTLILPLSAIAQSNQVNQTIVDQARGNGLQLNFNASGSPIHVYPRADHLKALGGIVNNNGGTPPLLYHGGPVMLTTTVYAIFWAPPQLQDGHATSLSAAYQTVQTNMLKEYFGHSLATNNTQYYQGSTTKTYIKSSGKFGGSFVDTAAYPGMDCVDNTPELTNANNCISDTDLQNEIKKVMTLKGWTGGLNKMFLLFTSSDEGQCINSANCSYAQYCAYHSSFVNGSGQTVIYGNEPFGDTNVCQATGAPSPNGNPAADAAATAASHELTEAITDPLGNAWFDSSGFEIGDECAYYYGFSGYLSGNANEMWDGHPFLLQTEYSNVLKNSFINIGTGSSFPGCFNSGPDL
ncbi:MAG TPA: hypothetical protein VFI95_25440 [Terriglobales bacterium]|nr:hypothetical protein [Terriglobales bacterium]